MPTLNVRMLSCWSNDADRQIEQRMEHLAAKSYPGLRWSWLVGDSSDATEDILRSFTTGKPRFEVVRRDTGLPNETLPKRLRRLSVVLTQQMELVADDDEVVIWHESDLVSPTDIVERLLALGHLPAAGWPTLEKDDQTVFYDSYMYRKDGQCFDNHRPYHPAYRADRPFFVDSAGSVVAFEASDVRGRTVTEGAIGELCEKVNKPIIVDPTLEIIQPPALWKFWLCDETES